eukprot:5434461-Pleurochrysis_carterae.AAC.1
MKDEGKGPAKFRKMWMQSYRRYHRLRHSLTPSRLPLWEFRHQVNASGWLADSVPPQRRDGARGGGLSALHLPPRRASRERGTELTSLADAQKDEGGLSER